MTGMKPWRIQARKGLKESALTAGISLLIVNGLMLPWSSEVRISPVGE